MSWANSIDSPSTYAYVSWKGMCEKSMRNQQSLALNTSLVCRKKDVYRDPGVCISYQHTPVYIRGLARNGSQVLILWPALLLEVTPHRYFAWIVCERWKFKSIKAVYKRHVYVPDGLCNCDANIRTDLVCVCVYNVVILVLPNKVLGIVNTFKNHIIAKIAYEISFRNQSCWLPFIFLHT